MSCPELERWTELADPARRDELERHLDECEDCRELVAALARVGSPDDTAFTPELAAPGASIGRYVVEGPIGSGGMGIVLAARDPQLDRTVALKLVRVIDRSPEAIAAARARLFAEARAMARLAHPNVVAVHEVGAAGDDLFIAMERVEGSDLATWLAEAPRSRPDRLRVVIDSARGIAAAHAAGLVHRDVKPSNILIGRDGRARITDLGLAAAIADLAGEAPALAEGSPATGAASRLVGTPGYLAPEVVAGARGDARADQYAFAVTAWQTLYGVRPPEGRRDRGRIARILSRALADRPEARFASMEVLVDRLERAARPQWPRIVVGALALVAVVLGAAWWRERDHAAAPDCAAATLGETWSWPRRIELGIEIAARDKSPGHQLAANVVDLVDQRARSWSAAVADVCAARQRGTESTVVADRRGSCLEDQRRQLVAVVAAIAEGTSPSRALTAVARLPLADACNTPPVGDPVPDDERHRAANSALVAIAALSSAGKYDEAKARLRALSAPADDGHLAATIAYRRADLEMRTGDSKAALPLVHEAVSVAERAHDDAVRLHAMIVLLRVLDDLGRTAETHALSPLVEAAAASQPLEGAGRALLENTLGNAAQTAGEYAESERHYRAAMAAEEREYGGIPSPELAGALDDLAMALHAQAKVADARELATRAVAMFERTVGPDHPDIAMPLTELGELALEAGSLDEAAAYFERVIAVRVAALGAEHPYVGEPTSMLGQVELRRGHVDRALALQRRALAIAEHGFGPGHPLVAAAQLHVAEILVDRDQRSEALPLAEASVKTWDASGASLPEAFDARFLLAQLVWDHDHARARLLAEAGRAGYAALAPPYDKTAKTIATWLAAHPGR